MVALFHQRSKSLQAGNWIYFGITQKMDNWLNAYMNLQAEFDNYTRKGIGYGMCREDNMHNNKMSLSLKINVDQKMVTSYINSQYKIQKLGYLRWHIELRIFITVRQHIELNFSHIIKYV